MTPAGIARMLERVAAEAGFECGCTRTCCATRVAISWPMTRATPARSKITSGIKQPGRRHKVDFGDPLRAAPSPEVRFASDSPLEGSGFEPSVPPGDRNRIASRCVPDGMWMPVPWRSCKEQHRLSMNLSHRAPGARPARRSRRPVRGLGNLRQRPAKPAPSVLDRHGGAPCRTASYVERYLASSANPGTTWSVAG
jgi:hypothetical protein